MVPAGVSAPVGTGGGTLHEHHRETIQKEGLSLLAVRGCASGQ
jgi:hypothetical protein